LRREKMRRTLILIVLLAGVFVCASYSISELERFHKEDPQNIDLAIELGIAYHDAGLEGDKDSVTKAIRILEDVLKRRDLGLARAYLGSSFLLRARDDWNPFGKLLNLNQGIDHLDRAVEGNPDDILIRVIRANAYANIPAFFGKLDVAISDFEIIVQVLAEEGLSIEIQLNARLKLVQLYMRNGMNDKAATHYEWLKENAPDSQATIMAGEELER